MLRKESDQESTTHVYRILKEMIFGWKLEPGEKINISKLALKLNVSTIPLREALSRLNSEKLVVLERNKGYRVSDILTETEMKDLSQARILFEGNAVTAIIRNNNAGIYRELIEITNAMSSINTEESYFKILEFVQTDEKFHSKIMEAGGNPILFEAYTRLYSHLHIARFYHSRGSVDKTEAVGEHFEIIEALKTRDLYRALEAVDAHLNGSRERLLAVSGDRIYPG
ncbi:GntR family transcriptional regulator [Planomicrobium sp. CPCC 101079]|uniref:GntR family transcriptional regulator n=1 Tax=Planomicrobium sp. CPCC 101079 TaxID=2599618 RepID=UPI001648E59A|nr:GntR family transcriptional regulator [Planomicrobium sp. CPCC 101079]